MAENTAASIVRELRRTYRALSPEQRVAGVAAVLLLVSTFGPFSFVEAAEVLIAVAVLALLRARALGKRFHLPLGDGSAIAAAGIWAAILIVVRLFDRPLGQNMLALGCAALLALAGVRERAKRPADDLPQEREPAAPSATEAQPGVRPATEAQPGVRPAVQPGPGAVHPEPAPPAAPGEQLSLPDADERAAQAPREA